MNKQFLHGLHHNLYVLLQEVVEKRCPELRPALEREGPLSEKERLVVQDCVGDELTATGFNDDDEPNERGLMLEGLIDWLGRSRA